MCVPLPPPPCLTLYRWARAEGCAIRREESLWDSHSKEESSHKWDPTPKRIEILLWVGSLQILACPLAVPCPPRLRVFGRLWYCPETSGTFQDLRGPFSTIPGPSEMVLGCSGTLWTTSGTLWDCFGTFQNYLDRFLAHPGYS